jgi:tRNA threonylcarbamoyladenosine modification (KEOPS) complex  Pcc1 subunit
MTFKVRTIDEIFQELLVEKQTMASLSALDPNGIIDETSLITALSDGSKVAEFVLWLYNIAVQIHITELRTLSAITDLETIVSTEKVPTANWYIGKVLEFQYDDDVIIDPVTYQIRYEVIDINKQIVGSAQIENQTNRVLLKVRRKDTNIFSQDELNALSSYLNDIKIAGTAIQLINYAGDLFTLNFDVVYDALFNLNDIKTNVETAVNNYLNNLSSNGYFISAALICDLQQIQGVKYIRFNQSTAIDALSVTTNFIHEYKSTAGWGEVNPSTPLTSTITYINSSI